jgi:hypothetical protein
MDKHEPQHQQQLREIEIKGCTDIGTCENMCQKFFDSCFQKYNLKHNATVRKQILVEENNPYLPTFENSRIEFNGRCSLFYSPRS